MISCNVNLSIFAAHEFRTPTQGILGFSEMLDLMLERKDYLKFIIRNATRLEKLARYFECFSN